MFYELGFAMFLWFYLFIYLSIYLFFNFDCLFCASAFEQGHMDPWRSKSALIIIIIIITPLVRSEGMPGYNPTGKE